MAEEKMMAMTKEERKIYRHEYYLRNKGIGALQDSAAIVEKALAYLRSHQHGG